MSAKTRILPVAALLMAASAFGDADYVDGAALQDAGLIKFWQLQLPLQPEEHVTEAYLVDDQIYVGTQTGYAYAVDAYTGTIRWLRQITTGSYRLWRPCHTADRVIFTTPPAVVQYDRYSGDPIRKLTLPFPAGGPAVTDGSRMYVGGLDQRIYAFGINNTFEDWKAGTAGPVISRPVLFDGNLYFAGEAGHVYCGKAADKTRVWQTRTVGSITADLWVDQGSVFVASRDRSLYRLSPQNGGRHWRARFSGALYEPPVAASDTAYQFCPEDGLVAVNIETIEDKDRFRWTLPRGRMLLTVDEHNAYVLSQDQSVLVAALKDGAIAHTIDAPDFDLGLPHPNAVAVFLLSRDGRIFCARKPGVPFVTSDDVRKALARGLVPAQQAEETEPEVAAETTEETPDFLSSEKPGPPIGGKSKVTKEYTGNGD